jgi:hypothetical protein
MPCLLHSRLTHLRPPSSSPAAEDRADGKKRGFLTTPSLSILSEAVSGLVGVSIRFLGEFLSKQMSVESVAFGLPMLLLQQF